MHAWGSDVEKPLHVRFRRRTTIHEPIVMDVGEKLPLTCGGSGRHRGVQCVAGDIFHRLILQTELSVFPPNAGEGGLDFLLEAGDEFAVGGDQPLLGFDLRHDRLLRCEGG